MLLHYKDKAAHFDPQSLAFGRDGLPTERLSLAPTAIAAAQESSRDRRQLERLVLNVANFCNLDCVYCYAQGGDYGGPHERMTAEVGKAALERFMQTYDEVATVQFFGGEPLLNWQTVRVLCQYGNDLADSLGRAHPTWMMSTNGTVISDEILAMIRDFDIRVTVSLDGPSEITDVLRPSRAGFATTARVVDNVRRMKEATGQPGQIEGTLTNTHLRAGFTVVDFLDWISATLGITALHMPPNVLPEGADLRGDPEAIPFGRVADVAEMYAAATEHTVDSLAHHPVGTRTLLGGAMDVVDDLLRPPIKEQSVVCPAGTGTIAVDSDGSVYPCFMFYRRPEFRIGHAKFGRSVRAEQQEKFVIPLSRVTSIGDRSWARRFVTGCAGGNFHKHGSHGTVGDEELLVAEAMVSAAVTTLAHLPDGELRFLPYAVDLFRLHLGAPLLA